MIPLILPSSQRARLLAAAVLILVVSSLLGYRSHSVAERQAAENSQSFAAIKAEPRQSSDQTTAAPVPTPTTQSTASASLSPCPSNTATGCDRSQLPSADANGTAGCTGTNTGTITASPIALDDISFIQPMGLMIGGHVTPIDHGYFYVKSARRDPPQKSSVYAPMDGTISVMHREHRGGDKAYDDYSLTIETSCTFRIRFSNLTGFDGDVGEQIGPLESGQTAMPNYHVTAGELIGYTGGDGVIQGIDVWVENDESTLTGFVNPDQYTEAESWKTHMVDFFAYTPEPLKSQLLALLERDAEPRWGKIDYDQDGKLVGTWFQVGTGGYGGIQSGGEGYWAGHLSIVPDGNDPGWTIVSIGSWQGQAQQFAVVGNTPNPASVDQSTGLVAYELGQIQYYSADTGKQWTGEEYLPHLRTKAGPTVGTVLLQLTGPHQLTMETFPGKTATQVSGFTDQAVMYER